MSQQVFNLVSGAGNTGIDELIRDTKAAIQKKKFKNKVFDRNIAFNVIPKIGDFEPNLFTQEEMKLQNESRKILSNKKINLTATTVRVPVLRSHSISLNIEFIKKINLKNIINALKKFKGIRVHDDLDPNLYPTLMTHPILMIALLDVLELIIHKKYSFSLGCRRSNQERGCIKCCSNCRSFKRQDKVVL